MCCGVVFNGEGFNWGLFNVILYLDEGVIRSFSYKSKRTIYTRETNIERIFYRHRLGKLIITGFCAVSYTHLTLPTIYSV